MKPNPVGRRLRISSTNPGSPESHTTTIHDADTGEFVDGVSKIVLTLDINKGFNEAQVTYYELGENGGAKRGIDGNPVQHTVKVQNVEIDDITAFEIMDTIRKEGKY